MSLLSGSVNFTYLLWVISNPISTTWTQLPKMTLRVSDPQWGHLWKARTLITQISCCTHRLPLTKHISPKCCCNFCSYKANLHTCVVSALGRRRCGHGRSVGWAPEHRWRWVEPDASYLSPYSSRCVPGPLHFVRAVSERHCLIHEYFWGSAFCADLLSYFSHVHQLCVGTTISSFPKVYSSHCRAWPTQGCLGQGGGVCHNHVLQTGGATALLPMTLWSRLGHDDRLMTRWASSSYTYNVSLNKY